MSELVTSVTNVCVSPLDFALTSLSQHSFDRSAAVAMSLNHSSNFMEAYSLQTAMSCSNDLVRFVCFCVVQKVFMYWHITSLKGSVDVGGGGR